MDEVHDATQFVARYYGCASHGTMSSTRYQLWMSKYNLYLDIQIKCEEGSIRKDSPELIPIECGCEKDEASKSQLQVTVPEGIDLAPLGVFKVLRCCCATDHLWANARCMSGTVQMTCTVSCGGHGMEECCKRLTNNASLPKNTWTVTMMTSTCLMAEMF